MIKTWFTSYRVSILLALITCILTLLGLPQAIRVINSLDKQIFLGASLGLFILAESLSSPSYKGNWSGFSRLAVYMLWLVVGFEVALVGVVFGNIISTIIRDQFHQEDGNYQALQEGIFRIANHGTTILAVHLCYQLLAGQYPVLQEQQPFYDLPIPIIALVVGSIVSYLVNFLVFPRTLSNVRDILTRDSLSEMVILLAALAIPLSMKIGWLPFLIIAAIVAAQNIRQTQVQRTEEELKLRMVEISTLNNFGSAVTTQISLPSVLELVYGELSRVIKATSFFVALYDDNHNTVAYPFVVKDGARVLWQKHSLAKGLIDHAIMEKRSFFVSEQDKSKLSKSIDIRNLDDAQYIVTPLLVGTKTIGAIGMSHANDARAFSQSDFELVQAIASQTSLAIRNANLYDRTVRLADNLSVINQSLQDVMFNLDRHDALRTACEIARNVTRAQKSAIFLLQPHKDHHMQRIESLGFEGLDFSQHIELQHNMFKSGPRVVVDVAITVFDDVREQAKLGQFQACLQVPLRSGNTVVGALGVYHDEPYYYETPELNLLEMLANQITAALDNADLLQALELYAAEQAQLVHLSRISSVSLDLERITNDVTSMLAQMMDMPYISVAMFYPERSVLRIETSDGDGFGLHVHELSVNNIPELQSILDPETINTLTIYYSNQEKHSEGLQEFLQEQFYQTLAILPMKIERKSLGLIFLADHKRREFSENDHRLLEMAGHQITTQIHNARVHMETQEALVQRLEQLDLIEEISKQISQALDLELIIENVLEAALQATHADFAAIALLDNDDQERFDIIGREVVGDQLIPYYTNLKSATGITGQVMLTGKMSLVADNQANEYYVIPEGAKSEFRSTLAIPLLKGESVVGVINLESMQPNHFTQSHASFINSLAGHAVISIDNAGLLRERENQINVLTRLREMALSSLSVISSAKMADTVLETALSVFDGNEGIIYRHNPDDKSLQAIAGIQKQGGELVSGMPLFPDSIAQKVASTGQSFSIENIDNELLYQQFGQKDQIQHRSMLAIPIVRRQEIQEILCIGFAQPKELTVEDMGTVALLAVQAAGHLENAALNEAITTSNDRMRAILDSTTDGIILLDSEGLIQDVNNAAAVLTNIAFSDYLQKPISAIIESGVQQEEVFESLVQTYMKFPETLQGKEFAFKHEDENLYLKTFVFRVNDDADETVGRLLVLRDVTKQKSLQDFHDRMQGMILHDLRGPLSSIITSMSMAINFISSPEDDSFEELLLPTIQASLDSANNLFELVETLQTLPTTADMQINPDTVKLLEVADKAKMALAATMLESHILVEIDVPEELTACIDPLLIRRVFVNLLHNAAKFTPENGRILIKADYESEKEAFLRVQIADTGPGIPDVERERIFGEFVQIAGRKARKGVKGMGIGLNYCKLAVEAHGGRIWVEEEKDGPLSGACFSFILPLTDVALNSSLAQNRQTQV